MPFTVSHAIVAVPFRRTRIPAAAVAAGAMVPDIGLYLPLAVARDATHAPLGVVTVDLVLGVLALLLWRYVLRAPLRSLAPRSVRARLMAPQPLPAGWSLLGIVIGSATHVVWDAFSHVDGAAVLLIPALQQEYGPFLGFKWVQYGSGVLGLLALAVLGVVWLVRTPPHPVADGGWWWRLPAWLAVAVGTAGPAVRVLAGASEHPFAQAYRGFVVEASIVAVVGALLSVLGVCVLWQLIALARRVLAPPRPLG